MKIRSICLIKNEADVVEECLTEAARWSDRIYVYDGASTDGTWEKVQAMAGERIIPWKSDGCVFREGLRADVFNDFREEAQEGDWWCQLNADEFYVQNVRDFLSAVPKSEHVVWGLNIQYYLTPEDVEGEDFTGEFQRDRHRIRYYKAACAERRFFRHRPALQWRGTDAWPQHLGVTHPQLLHFRHYPYRSPQQIQTRLDVRRDNRARGFEGWDHAKELTWQSKIVPRADLHLDPEDSRFIIEAECLRQHLEPTPQRLVKRFMHGTGLWP
jgi:hypothetical protein